MLDLSKATVMDIPSVKKDGDLLVLDSTATINTALQAFVGKGLLSAPVWDEEKQDFLGSMDLMDIVRTLVDTFDMEMIARHDVSKLMSNQALFTATPIKDIYDFSERNPWTPVTPDTSLIDVIKKMVPEGHLYIRRVAVLDPRSASKRQSLVSIVSQAGLIRHISRNKAYVPDGRHAKTVEEFYEPNKKVVSIEGGHVVLEAFQLMRKTGVSGVAVLDEEGHLIGSLSIRDLKGIVIDNGIDLNRLLMPARSYVNLISQMSLELTGAEKHPAVSVLVTDTLRSVIDKIAAAGVHRLFIVDEHSMPVGVVSLVDVLRALVTEM